MILVFQPKFGLEVNTQRVFVTFCLPGMAICRFLELVGVWMLVKKAAGKSNLEVGGLSDEKAHAVFVPRDGITDGHLLDLAENIMPTSQKSDDLIIPCKWLITRLVGKSSPR